LAAAKGQLNTGWLADIDYAVRAARTAGIEILMPFADGVPYWASGDPAKYRDASAIDRPASSARIIWTSSGPADSMVTYWVRGSTVKQAVSEPSGLTAHSTALTGLNRRTTYDYQVRSTASSGATAVSPTYSFSTRR